MAFHWAMAVAILFMLGLGYYMTRLEPGNEQFVLFQLHKSIGITVLLGAVLRLGWRLVNPVPPLPPHMKPWERWLAHVSHYGLYALIFAVPVLGWMVVSASPFQLPTFLFDTVPWPHIPVLEDVEDKDAVSAVLTDAHEWAAYGMLALLVLHVAGALKHHLVDRDATLRRMLPVGVEDAET